MNLYDEFFALIRLLNEAGLRYAVIGGVAMAFHGRPRFTRDIDLLIHPDDLDRARAELRRLGYQETAMPWTFGDSKLTLHRFLKTAGEEHLMVDVLAANTARQQDVIGNAVEAPAPSGVVRVASKRDLIWLKRARGSDQDRVDIKGLRHDKDRKGRAGPQ